MQSQSYKAQMGVIFLTVFLYLVGFGMMIPLGPYLATEFGASPSQVGYLMSVFSFMQFAFSPFWGRLSDRFGRRPIILICLLGEGFSYLLFAFAQDLWVLYLSRILAGFFGASIATSSAYISDITPAEKRSKGMALLGVAFGLGFVVGPFLSGILGAWGESISTRPPFGMSFSALWIAGICFLTFLFAYKVLRESLPEEIRKKPRSASQNRWQLWKVYAQKTPLNHLIVAFFLSTLAMAHMEATLFLLVKDKFSWGLQEASWGFAYVGVLMIFTQGFLVRRFLPFFGERVFLVLGLFMMGLGLTMIGWSESITVLAIMVTLLSLGNGLVTPSLMGSVSLSAGPQEQGEAMGVTQSGSALARIVGPALGGFFYGHLSVSMPFWVAGGISLLAILMLLRVYSSLPQSGKKEELEDVETVDLWQLRNLQEQRIPFVFLDLGVSESEDGLHELLQTSQKVSSKEALEQLEKICTSPEQPVVFICQQGQDSLKVARKAYKSGYINVYVIEGGYRALVEEVRSGH